MDIMLVKQAVLISVLLILSGLIIIGLIQREKSKIRVSRMTMPQKIQILNELAEPFGFFYLPTEDIFTSGLYAWQRKQGYEKIFDKAAVGFNMVFDAWPIYFDYEGRTWLIELWKGQYGINIGGEVGVYHAKGIVPEIFYGAAHFDAVTNSEMPEICCTLKRKNEEIYSLNAYHWWLTGFRMGAFSNPKDLCMAVEIRFDEPKMAEAFYEGIVKSGKSKGQEEICRNIVSVEMDFGMEITLPQKLHRALVQMINRINCKMFRGITHPFTETVDRMLFLYYQIPFCCRRMLQMKRLRYPRFHRKYKGRENGM